MNRSGKLGELRSALAKVDQKILRAYAQRMRLAQTIGTLKKEMQISIFDQNVENEVHKKAACYGQELGIELAQVNELMNLLIQHSREIQENSESALKAARMP